MEFLYKNGFQTIKLRQLTGSSKDKKFPQKPVIITFDDAHKTTKTIALPILKEYDLVAEYFVTTRRIGKSPFLTWDDLRELEKAGMSIQSHAVDHVYLNDLEVMEIKYQLEESKNVLEKSLKNPVQFFAPPRWKVELRGNINCKISGILWHMYLSNWWEYSYR
jgi:peptidoglycan/xylan/chitin deacetylase (PgdA/CDA1 family)